jgi:cell division protein FtsW
MLVFFAWRAVYISLTTPDRFASYGTMGCTFMIVLQAMLNLAVVSGSVPTTGIPLPFFSSGGSSLIMTLCMCGFILNASHCDAPDDFTYAKKQRTGNDSSEIIDIKSIDGVGK